MSAEDQSKDLKLMIKYSEAKFLSNTLFHFQDLSPGRATFLS
jgi:hypothetical protein